MPRNLPKLRTLTAYAARAKGAKLSFAYSLVTDKVVNPQFSTSLINTCRSCFAPTEIHLNVLVVEALGTAPKSSLPFNLSHQTVSYLYHVGMYLSIPFSNTFVIFVCSFSKNKSNMFIWFSYFCYGQHHTIPLCKIFIFYKKRPDIKW